MLNRTSAKFIRTQNPDQKNSKGTEAHFIGTKHLSLLQLFFCECLELLHILKRLFLEHAGH